MHDQVFSYTHKSCVVTNHIKSLVILAITRKGVLRVSVAHPRVIASRQHSSFRRNVAEVCRVVGNAVFDLTEPRVESQTSRSTNELNSARSTDQRKLLLYVTSKLLNYYNRFKNSFAVLLLLFVKFVVTKYIITFKLLVDRNRCSKLQTNDASLLVLYMITLL